MTPLEIIFPTMFVMFAGFVFFGTLALIERRRRKRRISKGITVRTKRR